MDENRLFREDKIIVKKIGHTTYRCTVKPKKEARESLTDKLVRLIKNADFDPETDPKNDHNVV